MSSISGKNCPNDCEQKAAMNLKGKITIEVGGTLFRTTKKTLSRIKKSRLSNLDENDESYDPITGYYFFDRNPQLFNWILDAYR